MRFRGRHRDPAAHHLHPSGETEPGRFRFLFKHLARAAGRAGGGLAGPGDGPALARLATPRSAVEFLIRAAILDGQQVGPRRTLSMPGLSATVAEQIEALGRVAGEEAVRLIRREPDESIMRIVETWAPALDATRAVRLGFAAENSFDEIIRVHIDDELGGTL
jgi:nucleoside-diphosphate-sugar epimerase